MRQFSPAVEQQDLVLLMRLSAIEITLLEMHLQARFRRLGNLLDCLCDLRCRSVKCRATDATFWRRMPDFWPLLKENREIHDGSKYNHPMTARQAQDILKQVASD